MVFAFNIPARFISGLRPSRNLAGVLLFIYDIDIKKGKMIPNFDISNILVEIKIFILGCIYVHMNFFIKGIYKA